MIVLISSLHRTTKTKNLPILSYVIRKPEPLGTEFKNIVDGVTYIMMWLELQDGKERMRKKEYSSELGGTAACVLRGVKSTESCQQFPETRDDNFDVNEHENISSQPGDMKLFLGDSWFGSVKAAIKVRKAGHHCCFNVKTSHARSQTNSY